jgi:hypothetical protein
MFKKLGEIIMKSKKLVPILLLFIFSNLMLAQGLVATNDVNAAKTDIEKVESLTEVVPSIAKPTIDKTIKFQIKNNALSKNGINYQIKENGFVTVRIFDYDGNEVANLINREQNAGNHYANFSTINLVPGIYKYCISVNDESICQRTLFVN